MQTNADTAEALLQKAQALVPILRQRAQATGQARRVADETIRDFRDAGLWYLLKPKKFGGSELRPDVAFTVASELSRGDGSAGWVWAVFTIHDLLVALWPEEFQQEYWARSPQPLAAVCTKAATSSVPTPTYTRYRGISWPGGRCRAIATGRSCWADLPRTRSRKTCCVPTACLLKSGRSTKGGLACLDCQQ